ncbi:unnamed protein product [Mycena citricolor]|uniref:Uncharacterized protein n=1 Tax=Mycena citricolor TaxID=2018698 RepID=A0AAD2H4I5_9AGAR|nr:unnamed protein product [Mycena citricolor]CAK5284326.1 unnamed protein product [Mycena citricolor]
MSKVVLLQIVNGMIQWNPKGTRTLDQPIMPTQSSAALMWRSIADRELFPYRCCRDSQEPARLIRSFKARHGFGR